MEATVMSAHNEAHFGRDGSVLFTTQDGSTIRLSRQQVEIVLHVAQHGHAAQQALHEPLFGHSRLELGSRGQQPAGWRPLTPTQRASLSRSLQRLVRHGLIQRPHKGFFRANAQTEGIVRLLEGKVSTAG